MFDVPDPLVVHVLHLTHDFTFLFLASLILGFLSVIDRTCAPSFLAQTLKW